MNALALALALSVNDSSRAQEVTLAPLPPRPTIERVSTLRTLQGASMIVLASIEATPSEVSSYTSTDKTLGIIFQ
jgi:hypothetical protein